MRVARLECAAAKSFLEEEDEFLTPECCLVVIGEGGKIKILILFRLFGQVPFTVRIGRQPIT